MKLQCDNESLISKAKRSELATACKLQSSKETIINQRFQRITCMKLATESSKTTVSKRSEYTPLMDTGVH